jgi:hypothetical protein
MPHLSMKRAETNAETTSSESFDCLTTRQIADVEGTEVPVSVLVTEQVTSSERPADGAREKRGARSLPGLPART